MTTLAYKDLKQARRRASDRAWRERNKDKVKERNRRWREKNKGYASNLNRAWRAANPGRDRKKRYGITLVQWDELFASQGSACAVCKTTEPGKQPWHTDHDHKTGVIRGILCFRCNTALGMVGDDYESVVRTMHSFIAYLSPTRTPG